MFIDDEEYDRRMRTEENLLNRLGNRSDDEISPEQEIPKTPEIDLDDILGISSPLTTQDLSSENYLKNDPAEIKEHKLHRLLNPQKLGPKGFHRDTQAAIGVAAGILGTTKSSRMNDVAISSAHSYERAYTNPVDLVNPAKSPKEDLQEKIIQGHGIIVDKCFNRMLKTLDLLDDDKLSKVQRAGELSQIAKNLSGIIGHASASTKDSIDVQEKSVHFHIMRPEIAKQEEYQVVEITSEKEEIAWREKSLL